MQLKCRVFGSPLEMQVVSTPLCSSAAGCGASNASVSSHISLDGTKAISEASMEPLIYMRRCAQVANRFALAASIDFRFFSSPETCG